MFVPWNYVCSDVKAERSCATPVPAHGSTVDEHLALVVNGAEMQDDALAAPTGWGSEAALNPDRLDEVSVLDS